MTPTITAELKPWDLLHVYLIVPYQKYIRKPQPCRATTKNYISITCMKIIDPAMGWFEIVKVMAFDIDKVTARND